MRRNFIAVAACLCSIALSACDNGNNSVEPIDNVSGTYALRTVNGTTLPYTFSDGSTLVSDVLTLFPDGTYSDAGQFSDGSVSVENGYYNSFNGSITLTVARTGQQYTASVSGSILTEIFTGLTEVFQRE